MGVTGYLAAASILATGVSTGVAIHNSNVQQDQAKADALALKNAQDQQAAQFDAAQETQKKNLADQQKQNQDQAAQVDLINTRNMALQSQAERRRAAGGRQSTILTGSQGLYDQGRGKTLLGA
jgi:Rad3-related DNA helicase